MALYGITNLDAFNKREQYHLRVLYRLKEKLEAQDKKTRTGLHHEKFEELNALIWAFNLFDEVSVEDE